MEIWMDSLKVIGRILTILPLLLFIGLFMGKRSIGELPVFDFLVVLVIGLVVGADIADPSIEHIHTVVAMIAIALLQKLIIHLKLRSRKIGGLLTFEPTVVVYDGKFLTDNLKRINYSIDNILQMLREKDVFELKDVELAIIEANGRLSLQLAADKNPVTLGDIGVSGAEVAYEIPVILDGKIQKEALDRLKKTPEWLRHQLGAKQIEDESEVFYAGLKGDELNLTIRGQVKPGVPPIFH